jgi:predicted DNA-binding transcriptional regulator YafY
MYSPAARLLAALDALQSRPGITATQLAERLRVNGRSVRRYVVMLQDMGIPVEAERGRYGGYRLRPGFKLPPLMLTEDEALAVTLGLLAAQRLGLAGPVPAVEGALAKIERVLPVALRERVHAVQETVALDLAPAGPQAALSAAADRVAALSAAAYRGRRIWLRYRRGDGAETERALDPYGLVYREGRWYVVGYCHLRQGVRVFRLDRVLHVEPREETFARPAGFDSLEYALRAFAAIPDRWLVEVLLETTLDRVRWSVPPGFATLEETPDGIVLRAYDNDLDHTARFLVGLDCRMKVRHPPELLDALRCLAEEIRRVAESK